MYVFDRHAFAHRLVARALTNCHRRPVFSGPAPALSQTHSPVSITSPLQRRSPDGDMPSFVHDIPVGTPKIASRLGTETDPRAAGTDQSGELVGIGVTVLKNLIGERSEPA